MEADLLRTVRLTLVPSTLHEARAQIAAMTPADRVHLSPIWLERVRVATGDDPWLLGFNIVHNGSGSTVGSCGFKGPPDQDGMVEIAYGIGASHQNQGYATEAAEALVRFAFDRDQVRVVRAHTLGDRNASARVLSKCGFTSVGQVVDPEDGLVWRWEKPR